MTRPPPKIMMTKRTTEMMRRIGIVMDGMVMECMVTGVFGFGRIRENSGALDRIGSSSGQDRDVPFLVQDVIAHQPPGGRRALTEGLRVLITVEIRLRAGQAVGCCDLLSLLPSLIGCGLMYSN